VKNDIKTSSVLLFIAIYCFAIGVGLKSSVLYDIQQTQTTEQEKSISTVSANLFCHTSQSENSLNSLKDFPTPSLKKSIKSLWASTETTEQFLEIAFSQYAFFSTNLLIRYRKANIIYPFHCFW